MLKKSSLILTGFLCLLSAAPGSALAMGGKKPCVDSEFVKTFDASHVSALSVSALHTFRQAIFRAEGEPEAAPSVEYQKAYVLYWGQDVDHNLPWISENIKKNPSNPRCASKFNADSLKVAMDRLRSYYNPAYYHRETQELFADALGQMNEIQTYYQLKK